ncbi:hypothetical protein BDZ94DRAFT_30117 [Collybia nuda]|uniref:Uncharacterized protein n=1 Tax=Collybia nuda TaxID=64659 RepID=A0A9P5YJD6_9AGAR|nr:hypothetical protein BDZ94DRAFT_30117 [Collybia nuda]
MSTWNLGINDVSEETQAFKDRLSSKDSQIAAQQTQLMRKAAELEELRSTLNDALHKLSHETNRVLQLENDLNSRSDDLRNEKVAVQNVGQALATAHETIKAKDLEARELEAHLQALSHSSDGHSARSAKLEREKSILEARVRELGANLEQLSCPSTTPRGTRATRPRSSSVSNFRITGLEQELNDARTTLSQRDDDLRLANEKLMQAQSDLFKASNERLATDKRLSKQIIELQATVEERDDELRYLRQQGSDESREGELLKRIEEDEAKIMALEKLLRSGQDDRALQDKLRWAEEKLKAEGKRISEVEERHIELIREREEALDELEHAHIEISRLNQSLAERENYIKTLPPRDQKADAIPGSLDLMDTTTDDPLITPTIHAQPLDLNTSDVERILNAIERVRGERDALKRNMTFLEYESKFAIEALEAKLASSSSMIEKVTDTSNETIQQLQSEVGTLGIRLTETANREVVAIQEKNQQIRHLSRTSMASAIVINHIHFQRLSLEKRLLDAYTLHGEMENHLTKAGAEQNELVQKLKEYEVKLDVTVLCLEATTSQRNDLMLQLDAKDEEREKEISELKGTLQEAQAELEDTDMRLADVSKSLQDVESERDSLALQIKNLSTDLRTAQDDLAHAESRYSSLQFHQLSSMSSNEATRALRDQIEELEMRVMRRTEQIGIHQHDIKRLETNLRLSEEHIDELSMELEMATAQKNAMVEDCADAREARDDALARLDQIETVMETKNDEGDTTVMALVGVVMETINNSRSRAKHLNDMVQQAKEKFHQLETSYQDTLLELERIPTLESQLSSSEAQALQLTLALAASQVHIHGTSNTLTCLQNTNDNLLREAQQQHNDFDKLYIDSVSLQEELEALRHEASASASNFSATKSELEAQICSLQASVVNIEAAHRITSTELESSRDRRDATDEVLKSEMAALKAKYVDELADMQARLTETSEALDTLKQCHELVKADHQKDLLHIKQSKQELEGRLSEASDFVMQLSQEKQQSELAQKETVSEIMRLERDLEVALVDVKEAQRSRDEIQKFCQKTSDELVQLRLDQDSHISRSIDQSNTHQRLVGELADLQSKYDSQTLELEKTTQKVDDLSRELQYEINGRFVDKEAHEKQLSLTTEQTRCAESSLAILGQELDAVKGHLKQSEQALEVLQGEKLSLQEQITSLEAEFQRSISLGRFMESQIKENESKMGTITSELERIQADLAHSEKAAKAAEVNLSLQGAQHKREMADVRRELSTLRSQPDLQVILGELEERNNEMEELLRAKCTEIEENDDRVLECVYHQLLPGMG